MDHFTRKHLSELLATPADVVISVYMPTIRAGREVRQNAIRFKNLIQKAADELRQRELHHGPLARRLGEVAQLQADDYWWQHQSDGLVLFLSDPRQAIYRLPLSFEESVSIGPRFEVRPLLPLLQGDGRFYMLAVSQRDVRLLEGSRYNVTQLEVQDLPTDLREALNIDEYMTSIQHHSNARRGLAMGDTMFHGHGGSGLDVMKRDEILQFFRRIDNALSNYFTDTTAPLVFAGVGYLFPLFQEAASYKGLVDTPVTGNPELLSAEEMHHHAWPLVEPIFQEARQEAWQRYQQLAGSERAVDQLPDIIKAAAAGQIDTLLIADGAERWGRIDPQSGDITPAQADDQDAQELVNVAVHHALTTGGTVYTRPEAIDGREAQNGADLGPAVAILRYPISETVLAR